MKTSDALGENLAIVLAAGRSTRFGSADKRLCRLPNGDTLLRTTYQQVYDAFDHVLVVLGKKDDAASLGLPEHSTCIYAPSSDKGMGSSLACAFEYVGQSLLYQQVDYAAVVLADMPYVQSTTLIELKKQANKASIVRPFYQYQAGHPVLFGRTFWQELSMLTGDSGAKNIIASHFGFLNKVNTQDSGVIFDIDTQAALSILMK